jgi:CRISPR/Cas system-associated exonuclease Cas4 (RecB family)
VVPVSAVVGECDVSEGKADEQKDADPHVDAREKTARIERERQELLRDVAAATTNDLRAKVGYVLTHFPVTRDSDVALAHLIWETFYPELIDDGRVRLEDMYRLPRQTTITRTRAKIQNDYGLFPAERWGRRVQAGEASLMDLARRMLAVLYREREPEMEIVGVEEPYDVPRIDLDTGEVLDRALVGTLDLLERDANGGLVVVDLKTSARKYSNLQVEASLQLSVYSYATQMNGLAVEQDLRLRFDVLTKTNQPELCRYSTTRDRAASVRLFRLAAKVLQAIESGVFHPNPGWQCKDCQFRSQCWAWR